jgi:hypothetical protein
MSSVTRRRSALTAARREISALVPNPTPAQQLLIEHAARIRAYIANIDDLFIRGSKMTPDGASLRIGFESTLSNHLAALGVRPP